MPHFPAHLSKTEAAIINKLITAILERPNLMARVYDGEEWATEWTRNRSTMQQEIAATDETRIYITALDKNGAATRIGSILLIHGNDEDVISDASWNPKHPYAEPTIDTLCKEANA